MSESDRVQVLLKEWELCQDNMKRHTDWVWYTGSIFVLLSIAALWALLQINDIALRRDYFWILAFFSISLIVIWFFAIVRRARKWAKTSRLLAREIEAELREIFYFKNPLLHTRIQDDDKNDKLTGYIGILLFVSVVVATWFLTGVAVGAIRVQLFG